MGSRPEPARGADPAADPRSPPKIIVADDNLTNLFIMRKLIERAGFVPLLAHDGVEALRLLERERVPLILLDINMPNMNGLETARAIRRLFAEDRPRVVAVTATDTPGQRERCEAAGFDHFISKPIVAQDFGHLIRAWLPEETGQGARG